MISVLVYSEADGSDVVIPRSGDEILSLEFETKNDAEDFARRAADLFADVDDVQLVRPWINFYRANRSSLAGSGNRDSNQLGFRGGA